MPVPLSVAVAADAVGVRADAAERELLAELRDHLVDLRRASAGSGPGADRRLRAADAVDRDALARDQAELVEAPVGVHLGDRAHPRLRRWQRGSGMLSTPVSRRYLL